MRDGLDFLKGGPYGDLPGGGGVFYTDGAAGAYRLGDAHTATPRRLAELLHDGAVQLCRRAVEALDAGDIEVAEDHLARAGRIVRQLQQSLRPDAAGDTADLRKRCGRARRLLIEAAHYRRRETVTETLSVLADPPPRFAALACCPAGEGGEWIA